MQNQDSQNGRNFAEIERDLLAAEDMLHDAERRIAEACSQRDEALAALNARQQEFEDAFAALQRRSSPGTHWSGHVTGHASGHEDALNLRAEDEIEIIDFNGAEDRSTQDKSAQDRAIRLADAPANRTNRHFQLLKSQVGSVELAAAGKN